MGDDDMEEDYDDELDDKLHVEDVSFTIVVERKDYFDKQELYE